MLHYFSSTYFGSILWPCHDVSDHFSIFCSSYTCEYSGTKKIDKIIAYVFVTPNFHKVHHHYLQPHTDSNYGNIFSIWDHIFGTVKKLDITRELVYGIDTHMKSHEHSSIKNLLMIPFQPYRSPVGSKFNNKR